jgi:hypothetical protein
VRFPLLISPARLLVLSEKKYRRSIFTLTCLAAFLAPIAASTDQSATSSPPPTTSSLREKSDTELFQLVTGQKEPVTQRSDYDWDERVKPSPLDRLWEMPARDAAVAFVTDCPGKDASGIKFEIDDPNARPPAKGEVGIRLIYGGHNYAPEGVTILRFDGHQSALLTSQVEVVGRLSKQELDRAVMKTDFHEIRQQVAQQTYEILWWLRHVRSVGSSSRGGVSNSSDGSGRFWMKPDGPVTDTAILGEPCEQWIGGESAIWQGTFAYALLRRLAERSGIKQRYPIPKVGRYVDNDPDSIFLRTTSPPDANDQDATKKWVGRLLAILQNPKRDFLYYSVIELLVPLYDPLRYNDERINGALLEILQQSEKASAAIDVTKHMAEPELDYSRFPNPKTLAKEEKARKERQNRRWLEASHLRWQKSELDSNAKSAAAKLGLRDVVSAFPDVLRLSPQEAALIVARHQELKPKFLEYLQPLISGESPGFAIDPIWRADLREFAPWLEKLANAELPAGEKQEFSSRQEASAVLLAWRETDPLTKTKLDIMLTGKIGSGDPIPEILRREFEALSSEDKAAVRNFVSWMRTINVPWMRKYMENVFTPHTPRPDNPMER